MNIARACRRLFILMTLGAGVATAQPFPQRPVTIVVPSTAGGVLDIVARTVGQPMSIELQQPVIVDNKPGGNSHLGASHVAKSGADGYTLLCAAGSTLVSGVSRNLNYAPMTDLVPIARIVSAPVFLVVAADSPFKSLAELIAYGKANPGKIFYASSGAGNSTHIGAEMFSSMVGLQATHVPYKGSVPALADIAGGRVTFMLDTRASTTALIQAGKIKPLAVTSRERVKDYPNVPAIHEQVPGYEIEGWVGLFAPRDTKPEVVARLSEALRKSIADPAVAQRLRDVSGEVTFLDPAASRKFMLEDHERINKVVRAANITVD